MAIVEVCDICRREISKENGITLKCSDMEGMEFVGICPVREKREYKIRICDKCIRICDKCKENIIKYCKNNARKR